MTRERLTRNEWFDIIWRIQNNGEKYKEVEVTDSEIAFYSGEDEENVSCDMSIERRKLTKREERNLLQTAKKYGWKVFVF